jgi:hypothetical protein
MSIGKTGHVLVRTSHSRGQLKGQRFQSSKSAMSGGLKLARKSAEVVHRRHLVGIIMRETRQPHRVCTIGRCLNPVPSARFDFLYGTLGAREPQGKERPACANRRWMIRPPNSIY